MSRYIDADKIDYTVTIVGIDENAGYRAVAFKSDIDDMPTADVVPKSEVEELLTRLNNVYVAIDVAEGDVYRLEKENDELKDTNQHLFEFIAEVKREIASEIFEEIDGIIEASEYELLDDFGDAIAKCHNGRMIADDIAELKKKYTEEQT